MQRDYPSHHTHHEFLESSFLPTCISSSPVICCVSLHEFSHAGSSCCGRFQTAWRTPPPFRTDVLHGYKEVACLCGHHCALKLLWEYAEFGHIASTVADVSRSSSKGLERIFQQASRAESVSSEHTVCVVTFVIIINLGIIRQWIACAELTVSGLSYAYVCCLLGVTSSSGVADTVQSILMRTSLFPSHRNVHFTSILRNLSCWLLWNREGPSTHHLLGRKEERGASARVSPP